MRRSTRPLVTDTQPSPRYRPSRYAYDGSWAGCHSTAMGGHERRHRPTVFCGTPLSSAPPDRTSLGEQQLAHSLTIRTSLRLTNVCSHGDRTDSPRTPRYKRGTQDSNLATAGFGDRVLKPIDTSAPCGCGLYRDRRRLDRAGAAIPSRDGHARRLCAGAAPARHPPPRPGPPDRLHPRRLYRLLRARAGPATARPRRRRRDHRRRRRGPDRARRGAGRRARRASCGPLSLRAAVRDAPRARPRRQAPGRHADPDRGGIRSWAVGVDLPARSRRQRDRAVRRPAARAVAALAHPRRAGGGLHDRAGHRRPHARGRRRGAARARGRGHRRGSPAPARRRPRAGAGLLRRRARLRGHGEPRRRDPPRGGRLSPPPRRQRLARARRQAAARRNRRPARVDRAAGLARRGRRGARARGRRGPHAPAPTRAASSCATRGRPRSPSGSVEPPQADADAGDEHAGGGT